MAKPQPNKNDAGNFGKRYKGSGETKKLATLFGVEDGYRVVILMV